MTAYYNEFDPFAAAWLRELIKEGLIADGEVDERSIADVRPGDLDGFTQCHFFAGIGGWSYALRLAGWPDDQPVWTGSCPCQPFSLAGAQKGFNDSRHLWPEFKRLIAERRPTVVFGEQVASAAEWLRLVRSDLEAMDYAVGAMPIQAASAGADHLRDRFWFVADDGFGRRVGASGRQGEQPRRAETVGTSNMVHTSREREREPYHQGHAVTGSGKAWSILSGAGDRGNDISDAQRSGIRGTRSTAPAGATPGVQGTEQQWERIRPDAGTVCDAGEFNWVIGADGKARRVKPGVRLLAHGFPGRVGLLRGFGNAIDPRPAAAFIKAAAGALT